MASRPPNRNARIKTRSVQSERSPSIKPAILRPARPPADARASFRGASAMPQIIGAGTYANNRTLAVSSTGLGEYVMRVVATKEMSDLMELASKSVGEATELVRKKIEDMGGSIGVVAIDRNGNIAMPFSGDGMYRGYALANGKVAIKIFRE